MKPTTFALFNYNQNNMKRKSIFSYKATLIVLLFLCILNPGKLSAGIKNNSVYVIPLNGTLIEYKEDKSKWADFLPKLIGLKPAKTIGMNHLLKNIASAKNNPKIEGIFLQGGSLSAGYGELKELRDALIDFKKSGKFVLAYADNYTQSNYYLASVANKVLINPFGSVDLKGLASRTTYYKNVIDKLGIEMQIVKVGTYKSAVEPFTSTHMSDYNREQVSVFLNSIWNNICSEMATTRQLPVDSINALANAYAALLPTDQVRQRKLVDKLIYEDQTDSLLNSYMLNGMKAVKLDHNYFNKKNRKSVKNQNKIAIIYADGDIGNKDGITASSMDKICRSVAANPAIKAVVLRVNSPGGSAFDSEKIWHSLSLIKAKKPLVVSMGNYAASGGYYISCNANKIIAEPTTITGSIGIFGMFPNLKGLNEKIGLSYDGVKTNKLSDAYGTDRPFTDEEREMMQANINRGYELYVKRCADGRHKSVDDIKQIAEGRVWTGEDALKIGLVDELGGLETALTEAAKLAHLNGYQTVVPILKSESGTPYLQSVEQKIETNLLQSKLGSYFDLFHEISNIRQNDPIQAKLMYDITTK